MTKDKSLLLKVYIISIVVPLVDLQDGSFCLLGSASHPHTSVVPIVLSIPMFVSVNRKERWPNNNNHDNNKTSVPTRILLLKLQYSNLLSTSFSKEIVDIKIYNDITFTAKKHSTIIKLSVLWLWLG